MMIVSRLSYFNFKTRKKRKVKVQKYRRRRCRLYITTKRKGKLTKIGKTSKISYNFTRVNSTTYEVSSISTPISGNTYKFDSDSYMTGIENYDSRYTSNDIDHFITTPIPTAKSYLKGIG